MRCARIFDTRADFSELFFDLENSRKSTGGLFDSYCATDPRWQLHAQIKKVGAHLGFPPSFIFVFAVRQ